MKVHVDVTWEDIQRGTRRSSGRCPIAMSVWRCTEGVLAATVTATKAWFYPSANELTGPFETCKMPKEATDFVFAFDRGEFVRPFAFDLELPDSLLNGAPR